jgi:hypothetical protein
LFCRKAMLRFSDLMVSRRGVAGLDGLTAEFPNPQWLGRGGG